MSSLSTWQVPYMLDKFIICLASYLYAWQVLYILHKFLICLTSSLLFQNSIKCKYKYFKNI